MRRFGWGVLAGVFVAGAAPAVANTIAWEETMTYYTYIYHPSEATSYVYSEHDPDEIGELLNPWVAPGFYINMGLPGAYEGQAAGRVVSFNVIVTQGYDLYDEYYFVDDLNVPGGYIYGNQYWLGNDYDESGNLVEQAYYGEPPSSGFVEFGLDMNIVSWSLGTGVLSDFCQFSGGIEQGGGETCNDYSSFGAPPLVEGELTHGTMLWYFTESAGWWEMVEEQAYRFVWYEREDGEYEGPDEQFLISRPGGGVITNPGDQGGGGGLPGPVPLAPVPLPASVLLLLSGLGALGAGRVWRRRAAA